MLILIGIFLTQLCYAIGGLNADSTRVEYQAYGNDTVYYKSFSSDNTVFCGLKQYEEEHYINRHHIYNDKKGEEYMERNFYQDKNSYPFCQYIVRKILEGFEKEQCSYFLDNYDGLSLPISIYICMGTDGKVVDLDFIYQAPFAEHMTNENIVRISKPILNSEPIPYFTEYAKMGIRMMPPFLIPILRRDIVSYLEEE